MQFERELRETIAQKLSKRRRASIAIAERLWQGPHGRLELVSIDKAAACAFIEAHHATLPYCNPRGMKKRRR